MVPIIDNLKKSKVFRGAFKTSNIYVGAICEKSGEKAVVYFSRKASS